MTETTQEERDHIRKHWRKGGLYQRILNDADRLAEIDRQVRKLVSNWRKETHGCCGCADELEAIIDAPDAGKGEG